MKRIFSVVICLAMLVSLCSFSSGAVSTKEEYNGLNVTKTVIKVPGLKTTYKFLQLADTHANVIPKDTSSVFYNFSVSRYNSFSKGMNYDYNEVVSRAYGYANSVGASAMLMTGDIIDCPSDENIEYLYNEVEKGGLTTMFTLGNHDWTCADSSYGYGNCFSTVQKETFWPKFQDLCTVESCGNTDNCHGSYIDFGEVVVVMLNNSEDTFQYSQSYRVLRSALALKKPTIVLYHVPLYAETIVDDAVDYWGVNPSCGSQNTGNTFDGWNKRVIEMLETSEYVVGLFTSHVHFEHEDLPYDLAFDTDTTISNGVTQYVCPPGHKGECRLIVLEGTDANCTHEFSTETVASATCKTRGRTASVCSKCGIEKKAVLDYVDHVYEDKLLYDSTCTTKGVMNHVCKYCNDTSSTDIDPKGHDYVLKSVITSPTVSSEGLGSYTCSRCSKTAELAIPKLSYTPGDCNLDGRVNARDVLILRLTVSGGLSLTEEQKAACDINADGRIRANDVLLLRKIIASGS